MSTPAQTTETSSVRLRRCAVAGALVLGLPALAAACSAAGSAAQHSETRASAGVSAPPAAGVSAPPAAVTPVPPPDPGDIHHTVAAGVAPVRPAVALSAVGDFGDHVTVHVTSVGATTAHAQGPGEVSGPGLVLTLRIENASPNRIDLSNVVVALQDSTGSPADPMSAAPARAFAGTLGAHANATGVYVFTVAPSQRKPVTVTVSYTSAAPVVVLAGDAP